MIALQAIPLAPAPPEARVDPIAIGDAKADPVVFHENTPELADKFMRGETGSNPVQVNLGRIGSGQDIEDALALISSHLPPATGVQTHVPCFTAKPVDAPDPERVVPGPMVSARA